MTTIAAPRTTFPTITVRRPAVWLAALAVIVAAAVTVWIVAATSTHHTRSTTPAQLTTVQGHSQYENQLCAPAPGTRFC